MFKSLEGVSKVSRGCLASVWRVSGMYLEGVLGCLNGYFRCLQGGGTGLDGGLCNPKDYWARICPQRSKVELNQMRKNFTL